jgi:hypothetical protein
LGPVSKDEGDTSGVTGNITLSDSTPSGKDYPILTDDTIDTVFTNNTDDIVFTNDTNVDIVLGGNFLEIIESTPGFSPSLSDSIRNDIATGTSTSRKTLFSTEGY